MKEKIRLKKIAKMTITENFIDGAITVILVFSYGHLGDFLKSDFLFHIHNHHKVDLNGISYHINIILLNRRENM